MRINNLNSNGFKKYLIYALGEIILVAIGVLLAIQANNFNESRKKAKELEQIYARVYVDIDNGIESGNILLEEYKNMEYLYRKVMNDSATAAMFGEGLAYIITGIIFYEYDETGIERLKNQNLKNDKSVELIELYDQAKRDLNAYSNAIEENVQDNLMYWRDEFAWFTPYVKNQINTDAADYFLNSQDYKNRVSYFYLSVYEGYLNVVSEFTRALEDWKSKYPS